MVQLQVWNKDYSEKTPPNSEDFRDAKVEVACMSFL